MLDEIYVDYSKRLLLNIGITDEWNIEAEKLFSLMDEDRKGHIEAEALQFWALSILVTEVNCLEPILLRKQTGAFLQEMHHTNGLVTMRGWKNYLIKKNWKDPFEIKELSEKFQQIIESWRNIRMTVFNSESLMNYNFLNSNNQDLPSIWNQCIVTCISSFVHLKNDSDKIQKYLRFLGLQLGSTASISTKGTIYIQGTHIRDIPEFSVFIMNNFLQFSGQYNTSANFSSLTQEAIDTLSLDSRFQAIRKSLQAFDNLLNIILYELIASCPKADKIKKSTTPSKSTSRLLYSSTTSILNGKIRSITPNSSFKDVSMIRRANNTVKTNKEQSGIRGNLSATRLRNKDVENMQHLYDNVSDIKKTQQFTNKSTNKSKNLGDKNIEIKAVYSKIDIQKEKIKEKTPEREKVIDKEKSYPKLSIPKLVNLKDSIKVKINQRGGGNEKEKIKSQTSRSPLRVNKIETYEQVMKRLNNNK